MNNTYTLNAVEAYLVDKFDLKELTAREMFRMLDIVEPDVMYQIFEHASGMEQEKKDDFEKFLDTDPEGGEIFHYLRDNVPDFEDVAEQAITRVKKNLLEQSALEE